MIDKIEKVWFYKGVRRKENLCGRDIMKIAIIDDLKEDRLQLSSLLKQYLDKFHLNYSIDEFENAEKFLSIFEKDMYDLCFMDIFMDRINGMQAARFLYRIDSDCLIIFLTTSPDYLADGYDVRAWRYLLKPVNTLVLEKILPDCIERINLHQCRLKVLVNRTETEIPFSKVIYIVSINRITTINLKNDTIRLSSHVSFTKVVEPLLEDYRFIKCGKGIVINMAHVEKMTEDEFLMDNGQVIPISRRELADVKKTYMNFSFVNL